MNMLKLSYAIMAFFLFFNLQGCGFNENGEKYKSPNIVYILADDLGVGDLSCYNQDSKIQTPNIDKLASEGMRFQDAHSGASVCTPTRYGLLTGRYCWRTGLKERVLSGYDPGLISEDRETVARLLKRNGYHTALVGKWHLGLDWQCKPGGNIPDIKNDITESEEKIDFSKPITNGPLQAGFEYFYGLAASWDFPPYIFIENDMIVEQPAIKKGGLVKNYFPELPPEEVTKSNRNIPLSWWRDGYASPDIKAEDAVKIITEKSISIIEKQDENEPLFLLVSYTAPHTPVVPRDAFLGLSQCGIYGDFCSELDYAVGEIIAALKKKNVFDNTIFIFTADNGASLRAIPRAKQKEFNHSPSQIYKGYKANLAEGGHRVPFIVSWPAKIQTNTVSNALVTLNDFYATCAELLGETPQPDAAEDSFSMLSSWMNEKEESDSLRIVIHNDFRGYFGIRKGDWKLIYPREGKEIALYNLKSDPAEKDNLLQKYPEKVQELTGDLTAAIENGRTTEGPAQVNTDGNYWEQTYWMDSSPGN